MSFYDAYLKIAETPEKHWNELNQATINTAWEDTAQLRYIKEQASDFSDNYTDMQVWLTTVADISINTQKDIADFIEVLFQDTTHRNRRGQKYLYDTNGDGSYQTYLCYDSVEPLSQTATSKLVRCNNYIKWVNDKTGSIVKEPSFIGYELSSTNNQVSKKGTVENRRLVCMVQGNENTLSIEPNQRFILGHHAAFKVTQVNSFIMEDINTEEVPLVTMYIEWDSVLPNDDLENNLANIGNINYDIVTNYNTTYDGINGYIGYIKPTITINGDIVNAKVLYKSNNTNVVTVDDNGMFKIVGAVGDTATIFVSLDNREDVYTSIDINVVASQSTDISVDDNEIIIKPIITSLTELSTQTFECGVYVNGLLSDKPITCTPSWEDDKAFTLAQIDDYTFELTNIGGYNKKPLILTFSSNNCQDVVMTIQLRSLI